MNSNTSVKLNESGNGLRKSVIESKIFKIKNNLRMGIDCKTVSECSVHFHSFKQISNQKSKQRKSNIWMRTL